MQYNGALLSPPDERDYKASQGYVAMGVRPAEYMPDKLLDPVNQGNVNSCVAESIAYFASYALYREIGILTEFNSMFPYHNRLPIHHQGPGMYVREALDQFVNDGIPTRKDFFSDRVEYPNAVMKMLIDTVRDKAKPNKAAKYFSMDTYDEICDAIYQNGAAIVVIAVKPSFVTFLNKDTYVVPIPSNSEVTIGNHAMVAVGYGKDGLFIPNSAGDYFGKGGFCILSPEYPLLERRGVVDEIHSWNVVSVKIGSMEMNKNGVVSLMDVAPCIRNSRTMVPLRAVGEAFGAAVEWVEATQTITMTYRGKTVTLKIGSPDMYVNGINVVLDTPAMIESDRTLVPLRAISEAFGADVEWVESTQTVYMRSRA